jgi:hypothetical protein
MMHDTLGPVVGKAHVLGEGMATVFATASKDFFTVMIDRSGRKYHMHRRVIRWRSSTEQHEQKEAA